MSSGGMLTEPVFPMAHEGAVTAYDLQFEDADGAYWTSPLRWEGSRVEPDASAAQDRVRVGRVGPMGPGIEQDQWPRDPKTGLPMLHAITMWLPSDYRRRGAEFGGFALFQGVGEGPDPYVPGAHPDPFIEDLNRHRDHPEQLVLTDILDGKFVVLWLTAAELASACAPPPDVRRPGEHQVGGGNPNAWDCVPTTLDVWATIRRDDPNVGIAPAEMTYQGTVTDSGYHDTWDPDRGDFQVWAAALQRDNHLGGTLFAVQNVPEGLTPFYLHLEELEGMNLGTGTLQFDFESHVFDWACS